jgi:serine/threonine protein kinase
LKGIEREIKFLTKVASLGCVTKPIERLTYNSEGKGGELSIKSYIVSELAENGDLYRYIDGQGGLPDPIMKNYVIQLLMAVNGMHKVGVCHRDLKLENLVLDSDFNIKITDFGLACKISGNLGSGFCYGSETVGT